MPILHKSVLALTCFFAAGCTTMQAADTEITATAQLVSNEGMPAGTATLLSRGSSTYISIEASGLSDGDHGFHLHQTGQCLAPAFKTAGGHLNPGNKSHGLYSPNGAHLGDLPNLKADDNGNASVESVLVGTRDTLIRDIFDDDGTAVVIHADPDDYVTDPAGDAGQRIICGVFEQAE